MNPEEKWEFDDELDENGRDKNGIAYPYEAPPFPANYHLRPGRERSPWEDMDASERLMADPSYIDRI